MAAPPKSRAEALITSLTWVGPGQEALTGPLAPRDECGEVEGAYDFRLALAEAVIARDTDALVALADPHIKLDFGGGEGRDELRERLASPGWNAWLELEKLLPLGCAATSDGRIAVPGYFTQDLGGDVFTTMIVTGEDVPLLAEPREGATAIASISWDVVDLDPELFNGDLTSYAKVLTRDGKSGWIAEDSLRSVIDYRVLAAKGENGWRMTAFIAGD